MHRRKVIAAIAAAPGFLHWQAASAPAARVAIKARKFVFEPSEVRVVSGHAVTFTLTAVDFPHGFGLPDFGVRCDLVPGKAVELTFTPNRIGRFHMLCDNFCGEEHDKMSGWFIVEAPG